jgi:hypothetical protein
MYRMDFLGSLSTTSMNFGCFSRVIYSDEYFLSPKVKNGSFLLYVVKVGDV